jgi:hypothetical protein
LASHPRGPNGPFLHSRRFCQSLQTATVGVDDEDVRGAESGVRRPEGIEVAPALIRAVRQPSPTASVGVDHVDVGPEGVTGFIGQERPTHP